MRKGAGCLPVTLLSPSMYIKVSHPASGFMYNSVRRFDCMLQVSVCRILPFHRQYSRKETDIYWRDRYLVLISENAPD